MFHTILSVTQMTHTFENDPDRDCSHSSMTGTFFLRSVLGASWGQVVRSVGSSSSSLSSSCSSYCRETFLWSAALLERKRRTCSGPLPRSDINHQSRRFTVSFRHQSLWATVPRRSDVNLFLYLFFSQLENCLQFSWFAIDPTSRTDVVVVVVVDVDVDDVTPLK